MKQLGRILIGTYALLMLILLLQCAEHRNPFDPKNKQTRGKPFKLNAEPYYGSVKLDWKSLTLADGTPMNIDYYQIYRKSGKNNWAPLDTTREIYFKDNSVLSEIEYFYKISALRKDEESDTSDAKKAIPYWHPKHLNKIFDYADCPEPFDMVCCPSCELIYMACHSSKDSKYYLVIINKDEKKEEDVEVGKIPTGVDFWHNTANDKDTILVCNNGERSLSVVAKNSDGNFKGIKKIIFQGKPFSVQVSQTLRKAFVSIENKNWIRVIDLNKMELLDSIITARCPKRLLLVADTGPLLVANEEDDKISIINLDSYIVTEVKVEDMPSDMAIVPGQDVAYVACHYNPPHQGKVRICAIDFNDGSRIPDREIILPADEYENHPISVEIVSEGPDDGLLFVGVKSDTSGGERSRVFAYHIGINKKDFVTVRIFPEISPRLIRLLNFGEQNKLYVLFWFGLYSYY